MVEIIEIDGLEEALFISRPNRFIVHVNFKGENIRCHLPNPGRMIELLQPWTSKLLIKFTDNPKRKTRASVVAVLTGKEVIQLNSNLVSDLIPAYMNDKNRSCLVDWKILRTEIPVAINSRKHRLDYLMEDTSGEKVYVEVKSTTLVRNGVACFPDAVSERAIHHLEALEELHQVGNKCLILFVVYRKARQFTSCGDIDPAFDKKFQEVIKDIQVLVLQVMSDYQGGKLTLKISGELPLVSSRIFLGTHP